MSPISPSWFPLSIVKIKYPLKSRDPFFSLLLTITLCNSGLGTPAITGKDTRWRPSGAPCWQQVFAPPPDLLRDQHSVVRP